MRAGDGAKLVGLGKTGKLPKLPEIRLIGFTGMGVTQIGKPLDFGRDLGEGMELCRRERPPLPFDDLRGRIAPRGAARAQVPRSAARRMPVSGWAAPSPAAGGRQRGV